MRTHALVLAGLALLVGAPSGIAAGRWLWTLFANEQGVTPEPIIHVITVVAGIVATLLIAVAIATFPARAAARTQPAVVLRAE